MPFPFIRIERQPGAAYMRAIRLEPDPWQCEVLDGNHRRLLLNCCRQSGKSTVVAMLSVLESLHVPGSLILLMSKSLRQSTELFRRVVEYHKRLGEKILVKQTAHELHLTNDRRIITLKKGSGVFSTFRTAGIQLCRKDSRPLFQDAKSAASTSASPAPSPPSGASSTMTTSSGSPASTTKASARSVTTFKRFRQMSPGTPTPPGPAYINELLSAGFTVRRGRNPIGLGIAAVSGRLENGALRILPGACPNLLREAELYCYAPDAASCRAETPLDSNNHALDALRYLIATIDERKLRRKPKLTANPDAATEQKKEKKWLRYDNEALWTPIW